MLTYLKLIYETFLKDEEGASAIEYGLIIGLIAVVLIIALGLIGGDLQTLFNSVAGEIPDGTGGDTAS